MRVYLTDNSGMTLVEVLVAGIISTIVAGSMLVLWSAFNTQIRDTSSTGVLQAQYGDVSYLIARNTRVAHLVLSQSFGRANDSCYRGDDTTQSLYFYNRAGICTTAVQLVNDTMYEYTTNGTELVGTPIAAGGRIVLVNAGSHFILNGCRNRVEMDLTLKLPRKDTFELYTPGRDVFQCRN
jgi:type II secretory pathway pseudopilin PulG